MLFTPASLLYSIQVPPTMDSLLPIVSTIFKLSIGPYSNFLISHHKHFPSVEVVTHSLPNLWAIQWKWVIGSIFYLYLELILYILLNKKRSYQNEIILRERFLRVQIFYFQYPRRLRDHCNILLRLYQYFYYCMPNQLQEKGHSIINRIRQDYGYSIQRLWFPFYQASIRIS